MQRKRLLSGRRLRAPIILPGGPGVLDLTGRWIRLAAADAPRPLMWDP
jgi:hypothetical protein